MLAKMIDKIISLKDTKTFVIGGENYSDRELFRIAPTEHRPDAIDVSGLDGLCKAIRKEYHRVGNVFVQIIDPIRVKVVTEYKDNMSRDKLYTATSDVPGFRPEWMSREEAQIKIRSLFIPNEGSSYLLELLSRMSDESAISSSDNGVTQTVEARQGISLKTNLPVKPRVVLQPFRTFLEVEQPASEFLIRVDKDRGIGIFEADGGVWKLEAKKNIAEFFERELKDMIEENRVTVLR